jgi:hypothetical protein
VLIVDDHLALLAIAGQMPELPGVRGPVVTTWGFHYRLCRALADSARSGTLSRRLADPAQGLRRALNPPAHRLVVLDPRASVDESVAAAVNHGANLLLAELIGAARHYDAAIRVTSANRGQSWNRVMEAERLDFDSVDV